MKTKIKPQGNEITDSHNKKITKVESNHTCLMKHADLTEKSGHYKT